jgi:methylenetetrahydrofolate dehydrogenase (NADP+)/methenyltetrahydrofolate cyclohydrolase/formyltetrahydrofolate synthetase
MTVALLMDNTLQSAERLWTLARERKIVPLKLNLLAKVPRCVQHPTIPDLESYGMECS